MNSPKLIAIVAVSKNGIIGSRGKIPWQSSEDLKWFKQTTMGKPVLMGRKTFESLPNGPLPGRQNIVISRMMKPVRGVKILSDIGKTSKLPYPEVYVIGGAEIYAQLLPRCSQLLITHMKKSYEGDTAFPKYLHLFEQESVIKDCDEFTIISYRRKF